MKVTYYVLEITETSKPSPASDDAASIFNVLEERYSTLDEIREDLKDRYSSINLTKLHKIHRDLKDGGDEVVGFIKSYWNKDCSHVGKSWWQADWIVITKHVDEITPVLLKGKL